LQPIFGSNQRKTPSSIAPPDVYFYAAISSSHLMPSAVDLSDEIQDMISHTAMTSKRTKVNEKLSAYDPNPMSLDARNFLQKVGQLGVLKAGEFVEAGNHK